MVITTPSDMMRLLLALALTAFAPALVSSAGISAKIVNGTVATANQFPYQAAIAVTTYAGTVTRCGGSLISSAYVLTAASCFDNGATLTVRIGNSNFSTGGQSWSLNMTYVTVHHQYNKTAMQNDTSVNMENNVAVVRLATYATVNNVSVSVIKILPNSMACGTTLRQFQVAGWGITWDGAVESEQLRWTTVNEITNADCMKIYGHIDPNQLCAKGATTESSCKGDTGSGLVLTSGTSKYLVAIASWGKTSCTTGTANVNQLITPYLDWLKVYTGNVGL